MLEEGIKKKAEEDFEFSKVEEDEICF